MAPAKELYDAWGADTGIDCKAIQSMLQKSGQMEGSKLTPTDVDLNFAKYADRGAKKLKFEQFEALMKFVAEKKGLKQKELIKKIHDKVGCGPRELLRKSQAPQKDSGPSKFFYDQSTYTGKHNPDTRANALDSDKVTMNELTNRQNILSDQVQRKKMGDNFTGDKLIKNDGRPHSEFDGTGNPNSRKRASLPPSVVKKEGKRSSKKGTSKKDEGEGGESEKGSKSDDKSDKEDGEKSEGSGDNKKKEGTLAPKAKKSTNGPHKEARKSKELKGPERFFYDKNTFTGAHKAGGPSIMDGGKVTMSNLTNRGNVQDDALHRNKNDKKVGSKK